MYYKAAKNKENPVKSSGGSGGSSVCQAAAARCWGRSIPKSDRRRDQAVASGSLTTSSNYLIRWGNLLSAHHVQEGIGASEWRLTTTKTRMNNRAGVACWFPTPALRCRGTAGLTSRPPSSLGSSHSGGGGCCRRWPRGARSPRRCPSLMAIAPRARSPGPPDAARRRPTSARSKP